MKRKLAKWINSIVFILKVILYASLLATFMLMFSINYFAVTTLSRTMATTVLTFGATGLMMVSIYGKYDIGRRKSKPIIYSLFLAFMITDIVTYGQLLIMSTLTPDAFAFQLSDIWILLGVIGIQTIIIVAFAYGGNELFFAIIPPERTIIITTRDSNLEKISCGLKKYKKQYNVMRVVDYRRSDLKEILSKMSAAVLYDLPREEREELVTYCYEHMINIYINPEISDVVENFAEHYLLDDVSLLNANVQGLTYEQRFVKRAFDIILSVLAIIICSPVILVCSILIKLDDGGKIFFIQKRATRGGRVFKVVKFRTMKENCKNVSATEDDERITKIGHVLRKYRLDELPQLINILVGDMSFVGPRPEMMENVYNYTRDLPEFKYRLKVKAGLTGLAQVVGKYNTSPKDKLILDMMYIERYSFWRDIKLLFQTVLVLLKKDSTEGFKKSGDIFVVEETPEQFRL